MILGIFEDVLAALVDRDFTYTTAELQYNDAYCGVTDLLAGGFVARRVLERLTWGGAMSHAFGILSGTVTSVIRSGNMQPIPQWPVIMANQMVGSLMGATPSHITSTARGLSTAMKLLVEQDPRKRRQLVDATRRGLVTEFPIVGGLLREPGSVAEHDMYAVAIVRAQRRGDTATVNRLANEYYQRSGHHISNLAIQHALQQMP